MKSFSFVLFAFLLVSVYSELLLPRHLKEMEANPSPYTKTPGVPEGLKLNKAHHLKVEGDAARTGYAPVKQDSESSLFWMLYTAKYMSEANKTQIPLIIWLQGGPGSSSQLGNFIEFGPNYLVNEDGKIVQKAREVSWNDKYHLMFVDQPIGVGYSIYATRDDLPTSQDEVAAHFTYFLQNLYANDLVDFQSNPLYIFGESYAGHYIPSISKAILEQQPTAKIRIPLKGVGIGNGWTDPVNQMSENGLFAYSLGLIDHEERATVEKYQMNAIYQVRRGNMLAARGAMDGVMDTIRNGAGGVNIYNFREFGAYNYTDLETFMNYPETKERYQAKGNFSKSNRDVYEALGNDFMASIADRVAYLLDRIPVLLFNGQDDIIVNTPSVLTWVQRMKWTRQQAFNDKDFEPWIVDGQNYGLVKQEGKLQFYIVNAAGHLVPKDNLIPSMVMLDSFIASVKQSEKVEQQNIRATEATA